MNIISQGASQNESQNQDLMSEVFIKALTQLLSLEINFPDRDLNQLDLLHPNGPST